MAGFLWASEKIAAPSFVLKNGGKQANCIFATAASNLARRFDILGR
jgi:hypothetical protein